MIDQVFTFSGYIPIGMCGHNKHGRKKLILSVYVMMALADQIVKWDLTNSTHQCMFEFISHAVILVQSYSLWRFVKYLTKCCYFEYRVNF